ncbi:MAG: Elongation factor G [bacterium ADurb.Bin363]|nr:MAG: Elongation factor G [bacterium ADurb.Bin363]
MNPVISRMRNIGISAHIDSGKTTLTERILYLRNKIHAIHEVKGKDGVGSTMDFMDLEKERGITITSASTRVEWKDTSINIIDTPGHIDFTIEVENALRVLDGAILVLCAVGGVQSQSITVDRQLKRYNVPTIAFINKCDRDGANPIKVKDQIKEKLRRNPLLMQLPIGLESKFEGVIDLVKMKVLYFEGYSGEIIREEAIPSSMVEEVNKYREKLIDGASIFSEELTEAFFEGTVTEEMIYAAVRRGTLLLQLTPVFIGTSLKNKAIQPLMDGIIHYLPDPGEVENTAIDLDKNEEEIKLVCDPKLPAVAIAFKLEKQVYGQLTYIRIYQGTIKKGQDLYNSRTKNRFKVGRLIRMHAHNMEDINYAVCGDIVALYGIDCSLGDTVTHGDVNYSLFSPYIPEPIISLAIKAKDKKSFDSISRALERFTKEDPTFKAFIDTETGQTIIRGMGELHLDVYIERMKREYNAEFETGLPEVSYRETITKAIPFDYTHKKQTGGRGQYARVSGIIEPSENGECTFIDNIKGGVIPQVYIPSCESGFKDCLYKGSLIEAPIVGVSMKVDDGKHHPVDSSRLAFELATIGAFREAYKKAKPIILEPVMNLTVESPSEFRGTVLASINQRRGTIINTHVDNGFTRIESVVPLGEIFGYATALRSLTQGKAEFTLEFLKYEKVPASIEEEIKSVKRET